MNENDRELLEGLRALAADGPREAPGHIEERLKTEFRKQKRRRNLLTWIPAFSVAVAAGIALLMWIRSETPRPAPASAVAVAAHAVDPVAEEDSDGFYPLPEAEALPAVENAMVVRVQLPVSSLQLMGVPVGEERADVECPSRSLARPGWPGARCAVGGVIFVRRNRIVSGKISDHFGWNNNRVSLGTATGTDGWSRGDFSLVRAEFGMSNKVVPGAPYSAQAVTQFTQTLANGNHIQRTTTASIARDSQGRTRAERSFGAIGALSAERGAGRTVMIFDPVASKSYVLDTGEPHRPVDADPGGADPRSCAYPRRSDQRKSWRPQRPKTWARR